MEMKLGIIGFGGMAHWHYENAPRAGVKVVAAYDIDPVRIQMARDLGLRAYDKLEDILADQEVNFILVATPNQVHKPLAIAALRAGKHVMVEKPATLSVADWDEMVAESVKAGRILTVHQNRRWDKDYRVMRSVVEAGKLGRVYSIESRVMGTGGALFGWRGGKEFGGGMLLDWGVHLVDQLVQMSWDKKIVSVYAELRSLLKQEVDDYNKILLRLDDGTMLHVEIGTFAFRKLPRWFVVGDGGTLSIGDFSVKDAGYTKPVYSETPIAPIVVMTEAGPTRMMAPRPPESQEDFPLSVTGIEGDWTELYKNLIATMNGEAKLIVTPESVRRVLQVLEALFRSAEEGRSLDVCL